MIQGNLGQPPGAAPAGGNWFSRNASWVVPAASTLFGIGRDFVQNRYNQQSNKLSWQQAVNMYKWQRDDAIADRDYTNAYNSPLATMDRLKEAGLNPHLVYGHGAASQPAAVTRGSSPHQPKVIRNETNAHTVLANSLSAQAAMAQIDLTRAQAANIRSQTVGTDYQNRMLSDDLFAVESQYRKEKALYGASMVRDDAQIKETERETANVLAGRDRRDTPTSTHGGPPKEILAVKELTQKIANAKATLTGTELENELKKYQTDIINSFGVSSQDARSIMEMLFKLVFLYTTKR